MEEKYKSDYKDKLEELISSNPDNKDYREICCPKCTAAVPSDDLNINDKLAKCPSCNVVFYFEGQLNTLGPNNTDDIVAKPKGFDVFVSNQFSEISLRQPPPLLYILLLSFLPFFLIISMVQYFKNNVAIAYYPMMTIIAINLFSLYRLTWRKNQRIHITIESGQLSIEYRPHNLHRRLQIDVKKIDQIYVTKSETGITLMGRINEDDGQKHIKLIPKLENLVDAKFLEQELERILGIPNKQVIGEQK